ncbi:restriction endonuclease subunit S [Streptomyces sp. Je 1-332]|uniref:restriction endonuclease subunit S n=1 Tax=Streptomyces sp. Je 1-332 TaxID=3231270 RepID=UPI0034586FCF
MSEGFAELPSGWVRAPLGDLTDTALGKMLDKKKNVDSSTRPYLRNVNVQWGQIDSSDVLEMAIPAGEVERFTVRKGDLLVCEGGEIGRCAIWKLDKEIAYQKALHRIRSSSALSVLYLRYYLEYAASTGILAKLATGSTIKHLPQQRLREVPVSLPPLPEQHRIVEALEEQLSRLDAARASLHLAELRASKFRQAVIDADLNEGESTPAVRLRDVLREPLRNGHSAKASTDHTGIRTLSLTAVTSAEFIDAHTKMTVADPARVRGLWLESGDLLVQRSNTPDLVGTAALYRGESDWAIYPDLLIRARLSESAIPEYVLLHLQSRRGRAYFKGRAKGLAGSMPKIDQAAIESFTFPLPDVDSQEVIVKRAEQEQERIAALSGEIFRAQKRAAALRNALLRKAFNGTLVPQDPADEPASVALERIAAERTAAVAAARKPRQLRKRATTRKTTAHAPEPTAAPATSTQPELFQ